jgi:hypothetical protein
MLHSSWLQQRVLCGGNYVGVCATGTTVTSRNMWQLKCSSSRSEHAALLYATLGSARKFLADIPKRRLQRCQVLMLLPQALYGQDSAEVIVIVINVACLFRAGVNVIIVS